MSWRNSSIKIADNRKLMNVDVYISFLNYRIGSKAQRYI